MPNEINLAAASSRAALYYQEKNTEALFGVKITTIPNIPRLAQGSPAWPQTADLHTDKPKTLILADWTAEQWDDSEVQRNKKLIAALMDKNFPIYLWQDGEFIALTKSTLHCLDDDEVRKKITPMPSVELIAQAKTAYGLKKKKTFVLDDHGLKCLACDDFSLPREINLHRIIHSYYYLSDAGFVDDKKNKIWNAIKNALPAASHILNNELSREALETADQLASALNLNTITQVYTHLAPIFRSDAAVFNQLSIEERAKITSLKTSANGEYFFSVLSNLLLTLKNLTKLDIFNLDLNRFLASFDQLNVFTKIEKLCLYECQLSLSQLMRLLESATHLKELTLNCHGLTPFGRDDDFSLERSLDSLEILSINNDLELRNVAQLLNHAKNLKKFTMTSCNSSSGDFNLIYPLDNLVEMSFAQSTIGTEVVSQLLNNAKNVKSLDLSICPLLSANFTVNQLLDKLETLNLNWSSVSAEHVSQLLNQAKNVKKINLSHCSELINGTFNLEHSLINLEELDLRGSSISTANLAELLKHTPNLKKLCLDDCIHLEYDVNLNPLVSFNTSLTKLEIIHASRSTLSAYNLAQLLNQTPNLERLYLDGCTKLGGDVNFTGSLTKLKELQLSRSNISSSNLTKVINQTPRIKKLALCEILNPSLRLLENFTGSFTYLEELDFSGSVMYGCHIDNIIKHTKRLKKLCFCNYGNGSGLHHDFRGIHFLNELEILDLDDSDITSSTFTAILSKTPKLKKLSLSGNCDRLSDRLKLNVSLDHLEELNLHNTSYLSIEALIELLLHFPNLKKLNLARSQNKWNGFKFKLPATLDKLEGIDFNGSDISLAILHEFIKNAPNLVSVNVDNCSKLSNKFKSAILNESLNSIQTLKERVPEFINEPESSSDVNLNKPKERQPGNILQYPDAIRGTPSGFASLPIPNPSAPSTEQLPATDPIYHHEERQHAKPPLPDFKFEFKNIHQTQNQAMLVEKLSQYLTLKGKSLELIPLLQAGICAALSSLYQDFPHYLKLNALSVEPSLSQAALWNNDFLAPIANWDGQKNTLTKSLSRLFKLLLRYLRDYQLNQANNTFHYLGHENLAAFFQSEPGQQFLFSNAGHELAVAREVKGWSIYDPNFVNGAKELNFEAMLTALKQSLGNLILLKNAPSTFVPKITQKQAFIQEGGLLTLIWADNASVILDSLEPLDELPGQLSPEELAGIKTRDVKGHPVWLRGILSPDRRLACFSQDLLAHFIQRVPDYEAQLRYSLAALGVKDIESYQKRVMQLLPDNPLRQQILALLAMAPALIDDYKQHYRSQIQPAAAPAAPDDIDAATYCQQLLGNGLKKQLLELTTQKDVVAMHLAFEQHCKQTGRPIFYVDSPDDLICSASFIHRQADKGLLSKGPGGALFEFLDTPYPEGCEPLIIINYAHFMPDDIVRFNSLLDDKRSVDGTPISSAFTIMGLIDVNNPDCYQGQDFYSRLNKVEPCRLSEASLATAGAEPPLFASHASEDVSTCTISLYQGIDWKEQLLGHWVIDGEQLFFKKGKLVEALEQGHTAIALHEAPWDNPHFKHFWQQAAIRGEITQSDWSLALPENLQLFSKKGYDWANLAKNVAIDSTSYHPAGVTLNPACSYAFLAQYVCDNETRSLHMLPGKLEELAGQTLHVNLTRDLNQDDWARLLSECQTHRVQLIVHAPTSIELNSPLFEHAQTPLVAVDSPEPALSIHTQIIESTEVDTTIAMLTRDESFLVIDISECEAHQLLTHINGRYDAEQQRLVFKQTVGAVLSALAEGKNVILNGTFSPALADELAPLLLSRQYDPAAEGTLFLVGSTMQAFNYLPVMHDTVSTETKIDCLRDYIYKEQISPAWLQQLTHLIDDEPLSTLKARLRAVKRAAGSSASDAGDAAWAGLHRLPAQPQLPPFNPATSAEETEVFIQTRLAQLMDRLHDAPYVFLTGLTGVGKTSFVETYLNGDNVALYKGESSLKAWAEDSSDKLKYLFIDEANIGSRQWSEFEGLFNIPPSILIDGKVHILTPEHKVIFAGNPLNYGEGRSLPNLFKRHGNALVFELLPPAFIYEILLKPVFENTPLAQDAEVISTLILNVYERLCSYTTHEVLISPRELQMMALLVLSHCAQQPNANPLAVVTHYAYQLAAPLVPSRHRAEFERDFKPQLSPPRAYSPSESDQQSSFLVTPSREPLVAALEDRLNLRELRTQSAAALNDAQCYGGLGGLFIEGESGIGKSKLVMHLLAARGYEKATDTNSPAKPFYYLPVSMQLEDKQRLLLKAFHEGAVVVIDEINSSPMMESLLNTLLMGETPDGKRPDQPGFLVIGTQNPPTKNSRRKPSTALARRLTTLELPPYPPHEMQAILQHEGLNLTCANALVELHVEENQQATQAKVKPEMKSSFRKLIELAKKIVQSHLKGKDLTQVDAVPSLAKKHSAVEPQSARFSRPTNFFGFPASQRSKRDPEIKHAQNVLVF